MRPRRAFGTLLLLTAFAGATSFASESAAQQRPGTTAPPDADKKRAAKAAWDDGETAFNKGDFRRSAESFELAYKLLPHHSALWNAARAWLKAGEDVRAANMLERYLNEAPANAPDRDRATLAIRDVDKRLGRVEIVANNVNDLKVDGQPLNGNRMWVVPGEHVATGEVDGKPIRKVVSVAAGDRVSVTLELVMREETVDHPPPPPPPQKPIPSWVFYTGVGATVVGGGLVVASGLDALEKGKAFEGNRQSAVRLADARDAQNRTNIVIGVTVGVAVLTGITYFFTDFGGSSEPRRSGARVMRDPLSFTF